MVFYRSKVDQIQEIVTGNPTVIKMVVSFNRGARGQNALRQILAPVVKEIMDDKSLNIKTDPVDIYKSWVNQMESQTGEARYGDRDTLPFTLSLLEQFIYPAICNLAVVAAVFLSKLFSRLLPHCDIISASMLCWTCASALCSDTVGMGSAGNAQQACCLPSFSG